jgi:hypothetical protein
MIAGGVLALASTVARPSPVFSDTGYAADAYGAADGYPLPLPGHARTKKQFVGYYSHYDEVRPADPIVKAGAPSMLKTSEQELTLNYPYGGQYRNLNDYLDRNPVTGLLIARGDSILYEHYRYGRKDSDKFLSQSMAKTIVGMLIGIAVSEGAIRSMISRTSMCRNSQITHTGRPRFGICSICLPAFIFLKTAMPATIEISWASIYSIRTAWAR